MKRPLSTTAAIAAVASAAAVSSPDALLASAAASAATNTASASASGHSHKHRRDDGGTNVDTNGVGGDDTHRHGRTRADSRVANVSGGETIWSGGAEHGPIVHRAQHEEHEGGGGGMITLDVNPTAGSDLLRKLSAAVDAADAAGEDKNHEQRRRRRRLVDAIGGGQGVYGLLEGIVLLPADDEEDGDAEDGDGDDDDEAVPTAVDDDMGSDGDSMHVSEDTTKNKANNTDKSNSRSDTRATSAVTVDPALLRDLGLSPADVRRHNARVRTFRRHRHLSRFERQYRLENGLDLELGMEVDVELEGELEGDVADDQDGAKDGGGAADGGSVASESKGGNMDADADTPHHHHQNHHHHHHHQNQNIRRNLLVHTPYNGVHPYQTTPLSQGYGTHYATVYVGTPPQRKSVIVDTGSHYTAFPCAGCANCGEEHRE